MRYTEAFTREGDGLATQIACRTRTTPERRRVRFFQTTGPHLNVERFEGASPAFLLIHGGGDGAFIWDLFAPTLAEHFTTLVVDLRGHGSSGWDLSGRYELKGYVSDLIHVLDHSDVDDFIVIGHSLGAHIAIHLRARYPQRVLASVLVDFAPELNPEGRSCAVRLLKESLRSYPTAEHYADWLKQTRPLAPPAMLEHIAASALLRDRNGFRLKLDPAVAEAFPDIQPAEAQLLWALLREQSCPTLIVRGAGSALLSHTTARRVVDVLPRGELATVNGAGHSVMIDNPVEFERTVFAFMEKLIELR
jgi:pimeloyl-ACP methyl ester carboxylesterase